MAEPAVLYEVRDRIARITLNRPENRNSMTNDVLEGLQKSVQRVRQDADLRAVLITGKGKSFCAGADFKTQVQRDSGAAVQAPQERSFAMYAPFLSVLEIEVPTIAALNGHAVGGGFGLALICDLRIANEDAKYGANFTKLGLHPGMASTYLLPRLVGVPKALELLLTGRIFSGREACEMGLMNDAVPGDEVGAKAEALALEIAACAPIAVRGTKRAIYQQLQWNPVEAARWEAHEQSRTLETEDSKEGIKALLEKRTPEFRGR